MLCRVFFCLFFLQMLIVDRCFDQRHRIRKRYRNISCYEEIGCLYTTEQWYHKIHRPINVVPLPRHTIKTNFLRVTLDCSMVQCTQDSIRFIPIVPGENQICLTNFTVERNRVIVFIHDFTSHGQTGWIRDMAIAIFQNHYQSHHHLISVDWESGAEPPLIQAAANARVVALEIVNFLNEITNQEDSPEIIIIGHGLGAHIAGYVGANFPISLIRGLDPTGPYFDHMPPDVVLDRNDATFVEIIHTDTYREGHQGMKMSSGSVDLFPNRGLDQPGCKVNTSLKTIEDLQLGDLRQGVVFPGCSHKRSFAYLFEAFLNIECEFIAFPCENEQDLYEGKCTKCLNHGEIACYKLEFQILSVPKNKIFFFGTNKAPPFCKQPYLVIINLGHPQSGGKSLVAEGYLELFIVGQNQTMTYITLNQHYPRELAHGENHTFFAYGDQVPIEVILEVKVKWFSSSSISFFGNNKIYISNFTIVTLKYPSNKIDISVRNDFCATQFDLGIENLVSKRFKRCYPLENFDGGDG